jgi:hypothetical protein
MAVQPAVSLVRAQQACCADLAGVEAFIGAEIIHPDGGDGTAHELAVYWRDAPAGRLMVPVPARLAPLTIPDVLACPCGWSGRVTDGGVA